MNSTNNLNLLVYLSPITTALVVVVWWFLRRQINEFATALNSKLSVDQVERIVVQKIQASEDRSDLTFVLTKVFEPYRMETKETIKEFMTEMKVTSENNYKEHGEIRNAISNNRDTVIKELQDSFAGVRTELTNIRKVASDSMLELSKERRNAGK